MIHLIVIGSLLLSASSAVCAEPKYSNDLSEWKVTEPPPESRKGDRAAWFYAANYSKLEWQVFTQGGKPSASLGDDGVSKPSVRPTFTPKAGGFSGGSAFAQVDDGWIVGFNQGEFGAALYWFSFDGKRSYKISDHQVVDFFSLSEGIYAIEGLAHLSMSEGSVIRITRSKTGAPWEAVSVVKLPYAPYSVSVSRVGTMLITLSDSLVSVGPDRKVHTLLPNAPWSGFYPTSSILAPDEKRLYIGMRQFVGEFDLSTNKLRFLIPSEDFLNKLPKEDEELTRKQHDG